MTTSPRTLRLINTSNKDLSLQLRRDTTRYNPRLRRGMHVTNIKIPRGQVYDVCKTLDVSFAEAQRIVDGSPMIKARKRSRDLLIREHPPSEENLVEEAAAEAQRLEAQAKTDAMSPPDPPNALPAGVRPEDVGLPADTPRQQHPPKKSSALFGVKESEPEPEEAEPEEAEDASTEEGEAEELPKIDVPSMEWSLRRLKTHAEKHDIDISKVRSKTAILKKIKEAEDGDS